MKLYHYTTFSKFTELILPQKRLRFGDFAKTNDPREKEVKFLAGMSIEDAKFLQENLRANAGLFQDERKKYKFISLCQDEDGMPGYLIPSMWAHYGEQHEGICIEIETDKLDLSNMTHKAITYNDNFQKPYTSKESMEDYVNQNIDTLFFTKSKAWTYEQEFRIVVKSDNKVQYLDITGAITEVYGGINMTDARYDILCLLCEKIDKVIMNRLNNNLDTQESMHKTLEEAGMHNKNRNQELRMHLNAKFPHLKSVFKEEDTNSK